MHVETDPKPLESIVLKSLNSAPKRLQRMLLRLQKYNLQVKYKKGKKMFLADTLSRAYLPEVHTCDVSQQLESVDHTRTLALAEDPLYRSSMHPQMIQYYKYYAKLLGVVGQNLSQRCPSASVHILISVMN